MPYCFLGSSIKYQGHTGWKIDDLNPVWVRLLGRSQLSNPSDLPCLSMKVSDLSCVILQNDVQMETVMGLFQKMIISHYFVMVCYLFMRCFYFDISWNVAIFYFVWYSLNAYLIVQKCLLYIQESETSYFCTYYFRILCKQSLVHIIF